MKLFLEEVLCRDQIHDYQLVNRFPKDLSQNKTILKQLKKANASLTQELEKCKTNIDETNSALGEAISCRDSCLIALQNKQNEFEKYKSFNDRTIDYDILQTKLNETLGLLARKDIDIKEGLKTKAYEISVVNQKHDELVKKSLLTKSQFAGQLKEKSKVISDLKLKKGSRTEDGFKRAFMTLFCQDLETFTGTMFLNVDQLEKQLDNKEFQEITSMASFKVLETQFQMFINSQIYLNDEYIVMTRNYFLEYIRLNILEFRDILIQNMDYVKKSIEKRALHKMEYDSRVNERLMQTTKEQVDSSKALDASLVIIESNGTESQEQDTSSRPGVTPPKIGYAAE
ncbi:hypothetical protein Tco_0023634 [Tanacetum coccineum]